MPSWKKIIISGSAAELSSLYAPSITGSLQGTSSYAVTASYAETSSFSLAASANRILVINKSGNTITKGTVVHLTGSTNSSDTPYIITASYESDNLSANTLGIAYETITFNSTGYVTTEGVLTGLNVTGYQNGQVVYLGATGSITGSAPLAPLHSVRLGQVVRDSPSNNGSIYVRIDNGYEIGELHDVTDTTTTTSFGDLLVKSGSVWTNSRQLTGSYALTGSLTITGSTTADLVRITQTGTGNVLLVEDSTNPDATPFRIDANGQTMLGTTTAYGPLTVRGNGATGVTMDVDGNAGSEWQSTRLFFKITGSASGLDTSIRNVSGSFLFSTLATANGSSGTVAMAISASGDVGIGTSSPGASLHLFRTNDPNLMIVERNATANAPIRYKNTIGSMYAGLSTSASFAVGTSTDLMNASTTFLTVLASGNVGIGTTTPNARLDVSGSAIISGSMVIGSSSLGPNENTLTLGARDTSAEGGQIGFNAPGGTYTSASFIDNWQNKARILKGNNTTSTGLIAQWDIHTTQMQLAGYTAASSFPGTATANLAVDAGGNVITVSTAGGTVFPYTGNATITGSLTVTQPIYVPINGGMYFQGGDDAALYDINVSNHMGIYGVQDSTVASVKLGSGGGIISGKSGNIGIGTTTPNAKLDVNGNAIITGSLSVTGITQGSYSNTVLIDTASGQLYYTASNAIGGSPSNTFPYTGSAVISGSLAVTNNITIENALYTSTTTEANIGSTTIYSVSTSSYDGAWFEYIIRSGSNARAGQIMSIWHGSAVNFTETTTTDFGSTSELSLGVYIINGAMTLTASAATNGWDVKTIVRSI